MAVYLDSSAIVKLAVREPESDVLRRHLRRKRPFVSSALARTEVMRSVLRYDDLAIASARRSLLRIDLVRVNDRILEIAGTMLPQTLRSLDAIHLATALRLADDLTELVTYDDRMADTARDMGFRVVAPS